LRRVGCERGGRRGEKPGVWAEMRGADAEGMMCEKGGVWGLSVI
jgi:hypothetical protein